MWFIVNDQDLHGFHLLIDKKQNILHALFEA